MVGQTLQNVTVPVGEADCCSCDGRDHHRRRWASVEADHANDEQAKRECPGLDLRELAGLALGLTAGILGGLDVDILE